MSHIHSNAARALRDVVGAIAAALTITVFVACLAEGTRPTAEYLRELFREYVSDPVPRAIWRFRWTYAPGMRLTAEDRQEILDRSLAAFWPQVDESFPQDRPVLLNCGLQWPWTCTPRIPERAFREPVHRDSVLQEDIQAPYLSLDFVEYEARSVRLTLSFLRCLGHTELLIRYRCERRRPHWECREDWRWEGKPPAPGPTFLLRLDSGRAVVLDPLIVSRAQHPDGRGAPALLDPRYLSAKGLARVRALEAIAFEGTALTSRDAIGSIELQRFTPGLYRFACSAVQRCANPPQSGASDARFYLIGREFLVFDLEYLDAVLEVYSGKDAYTWNGSVDRKREREWANAIGGSDHALVHVASRGCELAGGHYCLPASAFKRTDQ